MKGEKWKGNEAEAIGRGRERLKDQKDRWEVGGETIDGRNDD